MRVTTRHEHKFASGQSVQFSPGAMDGDAPRGRYVVTLCLPDDGIGFQYTIKSHDDAHERIVREQRLRAEAAPRL